MKEQAETIFHRLVGRCYGRWPRAVPSADRFRACRLISHRGEHDNQQRFENTLPAFDAAVDAGVWGIELDLRWTRDFFAVVFHDRGTCRLFDDSTAIADMTLETIKKRFPLIPTLGEVVDRYGGRVHLMIEIKAETYPAPAIQGRRMRNLLKDLAPGADFHLMGLDPPMFDRFTFLPPETFVPIARVRIDRFSRMTAARRFGGIAGHFLSATNGLVDRHHRMGQRVGTGFADSRRCLYREVARGVDWIFSNCAVAMQAVCDGKNPSDA